MAHPRLLASVERLARALRRVDRRVADAHGTSLSQQALLSLLADPERGPEPMNALAKRMGIALSTLTRNLDVMESRGWITRDRVADDRRVLTVTLTPEGKALAEKLARSREAFFRRAFGAFHRSDGLERGVALAHVATAIESAQEDA